MSPSSDPNADQLARRGFLKQAAVAGIAAGLPLAATASEQAAQPDATAGKSQKKIRVAHIGCGNVSGAYLADMTSRPYIEVVSVCDIIFERAQAAAKRFKIANAYPHIDQLMAGAEFDLLVNTTSMPSHYPLNKQALTAGKNVWCEKPMATEYDKGCELLELARSKGVGFWVAPTVVTSPQFRFMAEALAAKRLGRVSIAHASYGHNGPTWSAWFFQKGGGPLFDLGVYNTTTLTGLLGPAKAVMGMTGIVTPERVINGKTIKVEAEDVATMLIDHGNNVYSHIDTGFVHYSKEHHRDTTRDYYTLEIVGNDGRMYLSGYDWGPHGVDLATRKSPKVETCATEPGEYSWQYGASHVAECLLEGKKSLITPEHSLHVLEVLNACKESSQTGRRVAIQSTFGWPIIKAS